MPPLYKSGTFWFPQRSTYFILQDANVTPQKLYPRRWFLWDPMTLCPTGIACPNNKKHRLVRHGPIPAPRCGIDVDTRIFMIGYRYRCPECIHPKSGKINSVTFRSWDDLILKHLPKTLAAEMPVVFSHRRAVSTRLLHLIRACRQGGMGMKQFTDALHTLHLQNYDHIHLVYLHEISKRMGGVATYCGKKWIPFPPFDDRSPDGFHGYIPSAPLLWNFHDRLIESRSHDFYQHMAMLTGEVCAIDHSHKVCLISYTYSMLSQIWYYRS
jgi:hypothetical protein